MLYITTAGHVSSLYIAYEFEWGEPSSSSHTFKTFHTGKGQRSYSQYKAALSHT